MSPQETPRLPGCPQSPKRSATAERNAAARPTRKSQAKTGCHLNECCISEEVAAGTCESPIEMGNDGLAAPGITHRHPPTRETCTARIVALRMFISVACGVTVGVTVSPGLLFVRLGNGHLSGVRPRRRVTRARREPKSAGFHGPPFGSSKCSRTVTSHGSLFLALLRDCRLFGLAGVQDHREEAGPGLA